MRLVNAKEFSAESGFPLGFVRRCCREGKIPHWKLGKVYLMDYDSALNALVECSKPSKPVPSVSLPVATGAKCPGFGREYLASCLKDV